MAEHLGISDQNYESMNQTRILLPKILKKKLFFYRKNLIVMLPDSILFNNYDHKKMG